MGRTSAEGFAGRSTRPPDVSRRRKEFRCLRRTASDVSVARALIVLGVVLVGATRASGVLLYDNGPAWYPAGDSRCDFVNSNLPSACAGNGGWTYYDNFVLAADANVTGFDFLDWVYSLPSDYLGTVWSIYDADPFTSSPIASGTAVALLTATGVENSSINSDQFLFEVGGLDVDLAGGTMYWLGNQNIMTGGAGTTMVLVHNPGGGLDAAKVSDAGTYAFDLASNGNRAFRVHGTAVPEPSTALLTAAGFAALASIRRRRER